MTMESVGGIPVGSVIITTTQMYAELRAMGAKVDHLVDVVDPALTAVRVTQADHESRIRQLERRVWLASGMAAAMGAGVAQFLPGLT